jgi:hypothetical protein
MKCRPQIGGSHQPANRRWCTEPRCIKEWKYQGRESKPSRNCQPEELANADSVRRKELKMATWNVTGAKNREVELEYAMKAYKLGVLGLSE